MAKQTAKKNETKELYYQSPATERKVDLTTTIIIAAVALFGGILVGANWESIESYFGTKKKVAAIDFSSLNTIYQRLVVATATSKFFALRQTILRAKRAYLPAISFIRPTMKIFLCLILRVSQRNCAVLLVLR